MRKRPYDLLDYGRTQFDRDLLEFNVHIHDLEAGLQAGHGDGCGAGVRSGAAVHLGVPGNRPCPGLW